MKKTLRHLSPTEKIIVTLLVLIVLVTGVQIVQQFLYENSESTPISGGAYTEGAVGELGTLNPLFVHQGSITDDITRLIFSGLTKYDPETKQMVGDLATVEIAPDGKKYTFKIKEDALWHDGKKVTADDVFFTYNDIIQNPLFNGAILNYSDYSGTKVSKIDDKTVEFLLEKPDSFFLVKTMTGLLPRHLLASEQIDFLESSMFNFEPIGSGPYEYQGTVQFNDYTEVSLKKNEKYYSEQPHIDNIVVKLFPNFKSLLTKSKELDGIRVVPDSETPKVLNKNKFILERYQLPQYVAVFLNQDSPKLKKVNMRLALQLGTDKQSLIDSINQHQIIDTPLLEIDEKSWVHQFSIKKANGALFETGWLIPGKDTDIEEEIIEIEEVEEIDENEPDYINSPNEGRDVKTTQNKVIITGTTPGDTKEIIVNDYSLKRYIPGSKGWSYIASLEYDNLKRGENIFNVEIIDFNGNKKFLDSITITYGDALWFSEQDKKRVEVENLESTVLPIRVNNAGEPLEFTLITTEKPAVYQEVAELLYEQWKKIGIDVKIEVLDTATFRERLVSRDYDLLIFGQNLGYNLDAYPYWHSSQAKNEGLNLSQFKNFVADSLLEKARLEIDEEKRKETLKSLQTIMSEEVPAIFLYSPTYYTALSKDIQNVTIDNLATASDRLAHVTSWYARGQHTFREGIHWYHFFPWIIKQF